MDPFSFLNAVHPSYLADLYQKYLVNPDTVEPSWRAFFQGFDFGQIGTDAQEVMLQDAETKEKHNVEIPDDVKKEFQVINLIDAYRHRGHLFTKTNPVRARRTYRPEITLELFGLAQADLEQEFKAGEFKSDLKEERRTQLATLAEETIRKDKPLIAGVGSRK